MTHGSRFVLPLLSRWSPWQARPCGLSQTRSAMDNRCLGGSNA